MNILRLLSTPIIGAVIGYITNYLAVKMLFRPYHPVKIGNFTLPFTPGIIPKRKEELAKALGNMVNRYLLGEEDIINKLKSDDIKKLIIDGVYKAVTDKTDHESIKEMVTSVVSKEAYEDKKDELIQYTIDEIVAQIHTIDLASIIMDIMYDPSKKQNTFRIIRNSLTRSTLEAVNTRFQNYMNDQGRLIIKGILENEFDQLEDKKVEEIFGAFPEDKFKGVLEQSYDHLIDKYVGSFISNLKINEIVEEKINAMSVPELETVILSVMNKE
ncbi:MAG: DUF445 family protein [Faecalicoccus sp.]|nr:DUF445 family protein [Faecalicoccus sp.]